MNSYIGNSINITPITNTKRWLLVFTEKMKTTNVNDYSF